jgi:hypothetical protein
MTLAFRQIILNPGKKMDEWALFGLALDGNVYIFVPGSGGWVALSMEEVGNEPETV